MKLADILPEGDPPKPPPSWGHLQRPRCSRCNSDRIFPQTLHQRKDKFYGLPLYRIDVLCGDCGHLEERSDPDDLWDQMAKRRERRLDGGTTK